MTKLKSGNKLINWTPRPGVYQCVLPKGTVHITLYPNDNEAISTTLRFGEEVELREKEIRHLKRSGVLINGLLTPILYFELNDEGKEIEVEAFEDEYNPNLIGQNALYCKVQEMESIEEFQELLDSLTSDVTAARYVGACKALDTRSSFLAAAEKRYVELSDPFGGEKGKIDEIRKGMLTPKILR